MSTLLDRLLRRTGRVGAPPFGHTPSPNYRWADLGGVVIYGINASGDPREVSPGNPLPSNPAAGALVRIAAGTVLILTVNGDTPLPFATPVRHVTVQNNTPTDKHLDFDVAATPGSYLVPAGQERTFDLPCSTLHVYATAADNVNGSSAGNLVIWGGT